MLLIQAFLFCFQYIYYKSTKIYYIFRFSQVKPADIYDEPVKFILDFWFNVVFPVAGSAILWSVNTSDVVSNLNG